MASMVVGGLLGGLGSLFGGLFGKSAAEKAAQIQADAATKAAGMQQQEFNQSLDFTKGVYGNEQANLNPYITAGQGDLSTLQGLMPSLTTPYQSFTAPTGVDESNDPGYQARYQMGLDALNNGAAAKGGLLSGGTLKAAENYAQDYASNEYQNVYSRALNTYGANQSNYYTGQGNTFNRYASLAGSGLQASADLGSEGTAASGQVGTTLAELGNSQATGINNAAAAQASGVVGGANALSGGIQGGLDSLGSSLTLQSLLAQRNSGYGNPGSPQTGAYTSPSTWGPYNPNYNPNQGSVQGFARGGRVRKGQLILVGEKGPELFVAPKDGKILPNRYARLAA